MFVYENSSIAAINHNNNILQAICTNPTLFRDLFPIPVYGRIYYDKTIKFPEIYPYPEFGFKGVKASAELAFLGINDWAVHYKPIFPSYVPHTHKDILEDLTISSQNGGGLYIYGGGKFLRPRRLLITGCKSTPLHIEAFDSGLVESVYVLENHSITPCPSTLKQAHATNFIDFKVRENKTPLALQIEDCSDMPVQGTIESNSGLGMVARRWTRSNRDIWFEANNMVKLPNGEFHRFQAEIYESFNNVAQGQSHREKNLIYYDEISYAGTREDSLYIDNTSLKSCGDSLIHRFDLSTPNGYDYVEVHNDAAQQLNWISIKQKGYELENATGSEWIRIDWTDPTLVNFKGKKDQYFSLSFDILLEQEVAAYLADQIRNSPNPIPLTYFAFAGGTVGIGDVIYAHKPGYTKFKFVGKATADFTGLTLYFKPILYPSNGPEKDISFGLGNFELYSTQI